MVVSSCRDGPTPLLVPLDDRRRPDVRLIGILAELAPRVALPQQMPAFVQLNLIFSSRT